MRRPPAFEQQLGLESNPDGGWSSSCSTDNSGLDASSSGTRLSLARNVESDQVELPGMSAGVHQNPKIIGAPDGAQSICR